MHGGREEPLPTPRMPPYPALASAFSSSTWTVTPGRLGRGDRLGRERRRRQVGGRDVDPVAGEVHGLDDGVRASDRGLDRLVPPGAADQAERLDGRLDPVAAGTR